MNTPRCRGNFLPRLYIGEKFSLFVSGRMVTSKNYWGMVTRLTAACLEKVLRVYLPTIPSLSLSGLFTSACPFVFPKGCPQRTLVRYGGHSTILSLSAFFSKLYADVRVISDRVI